MVRRFDVCNGDADGLCAVLQWRLHEPGPAELVTGLKRDIALLGRVCAGAGDEVNVFDISMQRNRSSLTHLLGDGVRVRYFDHHAAGEMSVHPNLETHVDESSDVCTSLLVNRYLGGAHRAWALVGIYGDNMGAVADRLALDGGFEPGDCAGLRRLGVLINYNAYGEYEHDVCIAPACCSRGWRVTRTRATCWPTRMSSMRSMRCATKTFIRPLQPPCCGRAPRATCACCPTRPGAGA